MEKKGFKRWQKGNYDRLYVPAKILGLELEFHTTGSIRTARFNGERISNSAGYRLRNASTYIDVNTGNVYSDVSDLKTAAEKIVKLA